MNKSNKFTLNEITNQFMQIIKKHFLIKVLLLESLLFFLLINTSYYWEGELGLFAFPVFLILFINYLVLVIALFVQVYRALSEKFANQWRSITLIVIPIVVLLTSLKPSGIIDFDQLEGEDLLIAEREGAANCMITLKFKDNFTFRERSVCFGVTEVKGHYHLKNDTIYLDHVHLGRHEPEYYKFGLVRSHRSNKNVQYFELTMYKDLKDTVGFVIGVKKNTLIKFKAN